MHTKYKAYQLITTGLTTIHRLIILTIIIIISSIVNYPVECSYFVNYIITFIEPYYRCTITMSDEHVVTTVFLLATYLRHLHSDG